MECNLHLCGGTLQINSQKNIIGNRCRVVDNRFSTLTRHKECFGDTRALDSCHVNHGGGDNLRLQIGGGGYSVQLALALGSIGNKIYIVANIWIKIALRCCKLVALCERCRNLETLVIVLIYGICIARKEEQIHMRHLRLNIGIGDRTCCTTALGAEVKQQLALGSIRLKTAEIIANRARGHK